MINYVNKIINCDALEGLKELEDNSIDLIITDPPYNISQRKTINRTKINNKSLRRNGVRSKELNFNFGEWDFFETKEKYLDFIKKVGIELFRVAKDNCSLFMWCPRSEISFIEENLREGGWYVRSTLVFCKTNPAPQIFKVGFMSATEFAVFCTKHSGRKHIWNVEYGQQKNYWIRGIVQGKERTEHPTQKPLDITQLWIKLTSKEGSLVLDPFMGSGTTAIASKILNRNFIGFELNPDYVKLSQNRVQPYLQQKKLSKGKQENLWFSSTSKASG